MGLHIAVLGAGFVGRIHIEACLSHPAVSAVSVAETDPALLQSAISDYQLKRAESDYRVLLDDASIDIVYICLPHDMHYPIALKSFAAGKHVITEKPISNTLAEADAMIAAAERAGRRFFVALNQRFLPVHQQVKLLLDEGVIGAPVMASLTIAGTELERMCIPGHWKGTFGRAGGGALADSGTHIVDLMHYWFGMPEAVQCSLGRHVVKAVNKADDTASLILEYPGLTATLMVGYGAAGQPWSEMRRLWSEEGSIHVQLEVENPITVWKKGESVPQEVEHNVEWWPYSVKRVAKHALDCFADDQPFAVTPKDARESLCTIRAAYQAAIQGRRITRKDFVEKEL